MTAEPAPVVDAATIAVPDLSNPIWLIRHAPTDWTGQRWCGRADPPLSQAGRAAADEVARTVRASADFERGATIRSSPARRAQATALAIASATGWPIAEDDDLLEVDVGLVEGLTWADLETQRPDLAAAVGRGERVEWPGGETIAAIDERARRAADRVLAEASRGAVIVVSHGALLRELGVAIASEPVAFFAPGGIQRLVPGLR